MFVLIFFIFDSLIFKVFVFLSNSLWHSGLLEYISAYASTSKSNQFKYLVSSSVLSIFALELKPAPTKTDIALLESFSEI